MINEPGMLLLASAHDIRTQRERQAGAVVRVRGEVGQQRGGEVGDVLLLLGGPRPARGEHRVDVKANRQTQPCDGHAVALPRGQVPQHPQRVRHHRERTDLLLRGSVQLVLLVVVLLQHDRVLVRGRLAQRSALRGGHHAQARLSRWRFCFRLLVAGEHVA
eukprot:5861075-Pyramimonas_sp.AAC.1